MSPVELRDQSYSEILADFTAGSREANPVAALPYARRGLHQLHNAALGGQCASLTPQQRDNLIGAHMGLLHNISDTLKEGGPLVALPAWCRGPVGIIIFWHDLQAIDPGLVPDVVSLGSSFLHLVADVELLHSMIARHQETPGLLAFIDQAINDHRNSQPLSH